MEDEAGQTRGTVLDGLHYWNISQIVPGRGCPGHATPLRPLYGLGLSEGGAGKGAHKIFTQSAPLIPPSPPSHTCVGFRKDILRAQYPYPQSPPAWVGEAGLDLWQDGGVHWRQGNCALERSPLDCLETHLTDLRGTQNGLEEKGGGGRQHYRVPSCVGPYPCKIGMGMDAKDRVLRRDR